MIRLGVTESTPSFFGYQKFAHIEGLPFQGLCGRRLDECRSEESIVIERKHWPEKYWTKVCKQCVQERDRRAR